jgi:PAS domain S-box-containing protein
MDFLHFPEAIVLLNPETMSIVSANLAFCNLFGISPQALKSSTSLQTYCSEQGNDAICSHNSLDQALDKMRSSDKYDRLRLVFRRPDSSSFTADLTPFPLAKKKDHPEVAILVRDVTEKIRRKSYWNLLHTVHTHCSKIEQTKLLLETIISEIRKQTKCDAAGFRLLDGGDYPYAASEGFSGDFLIKENSILHHNAQGDICRNPDGSPSLECTCGLIISGKTDPSSPLFTEYGSCWTNDSPSVLHLSKEEDPRSEPRNECIHQGYQSIALIPLRDEDKVMGLLQLNAKPRGFFSPELIDILETMAASIGTELTRRKSKARLYNKRQFLTELIEAVPLPVFAKNLEGRYTICNRRFEEFLGCSKDAILGKSVFDTAPPDLAKIYHEQDLKLLHASAHKQQVYEAKVSVKEEGLRDVIFHKANIKDASGQISGLIGVITDVTDEKAVKQALLETEQRFKLATHGTGIGIWDYYPNEDRLVWDDKMFDLYHKHPDDFHGHLRDWTECLPTEQRDHLVEDFKNSILSEEFYSREFSIILPNEEPRYLLSAAYFSRDNNGKVERVTGVNYDITKRVNAEKENAQLQAQLLHSSKLESIGTLAAGIAHEINTPVQFVGDNIKFLGDALNDLFQLIQETRSSLEKAAQNDAVSSCLDDFKKSAERADFAFLQEEAPSAIQQSMEGVKRVADIVKAMRAFSHPDAGEKTVADLNTCVNDTVVISRNEWKYAADLTTDLDPDLPYVLCHKGAINQVLMNLIVNAAHSIESKQGAETGQDISGKGSIGIKTYSSDEMVVIEISDTGTGIPESIRSKLFDPFFTTKEVGKGTGQGLAISRQIITKDHNGQLLFETEPGKGTTFIIKLPIEK